MKRPTIKQIRKATLKEQFERVSAELKDAHKSTNHYMTESRQFAERVKQIAAENESLRSDIKWFKQLIQYVVMPASTSPRI